MRRTTQITFACLLVLAGLTVPMSTGPQPAAAAEATVSTCDWPTFSQTLDEVQDDGGGTITFDCSDTILFESEKAITTEVTITGNDGVVFDGQESTRLFTVNSGARLVLNNLTLQNGNSDRAHGGAISNEGTLEITASTVRDNSTTRVDDSFDFNGGAIYNSGPLKITASIFSGNFADREGGAIYNAGGRLEISASTFSDNSTGRLGSGGTILNTGTLEITASTFSGNRAPMSGEGGAISNEGTLEITASTFSGNSASSGGAILNRGTLVISTSTFSGNSSVFLGRTIYNQGPLEITASTFTSNSVGPAGVIYNDRNRATVRGSILTNSRVGANCNGTPITSLGYNLSDDDSCNLTSTGDLPNTDPMLEPLGHYGGPTQTFRPLPASPAIDRIPASQCPTTGRAVLPDQRGIPRPQNGWCDIGSVEVVVDLCIHHSTGALSDPGLSGCGRYARTVSLEYGGPLTFCANRVTGDLYLSPSGQCSQTQLRLVLPDDGPVTVCIDRVTRLMRLASASGCTRYEVARLIGGLPPGPAS